jgi:hypothetical protein
VHVNISGSVVDVEDGGQVVVDGKDTPNVHLQGTEQNYVESFEPQMLLEVDDAHIDVFLVEIE